jgi:ribonuclease HI
VVEENDNDYGRAFYRAQGGGRFHDFPGVLAYTDGSLMDSDRGITMGFGACFPRGELDELWGPTIQKGARLPSSLLPEADAITAVLTAVQGDLDLAIGTDSATILFAIKKAAKTDFADLSAIKRHASHMGPLVEALASRTGTTVLFKVDGHRGHQGNERADELADKGRQEIRHPELQKKESLQLTWGTADNSRTCDLSEARQVLRQGDGVRAKKAVSSKSTSAAAFLSETGTGLHELGKVLSSSVKWEHRTLLQGITGITPTNHHLAKFKPGQSRACPLAGCQEEDETVAHVQNWCPALSEARIAAHNYIRKKATKVMWSALRRQESGWEMKEETSFKQAGLPCTLEDERRRPDCIFMNYKCRQVFLIEFTRTWDKDLKSLRKSERRKKKQYTRAAETIRQEWDSWTVRVIPVVVGTRGRISEASFHSYLRRMKLDDKTRHRIHAAITKGAIRQMAEMMRARAAALRAGNQAAHSKETRQQCALERPPMQRAG